MHCSQKQQSTIRTHISIFGRLNLLIQPCFHKLCVGWSRHRCIAACHGAGAWDYSISVPSRLSKACFSWLYMTCFRGLQKLFVGSVLQMLMWRIRYMIFTQQLILYYNFVEAQSYKVLLLKSHSLTNISINKVLWSLTIVMPILLASFHSIFSVFIFAAKSVFFLYPNISNCYFHNLHMFLSSA